MKASMKYATGQDSLEGKKVAIQGAGHVASYLTNTYKKRVQNSIFLTFLQKTSY